MQVMLRSCRWLAKGLSRWAAPRDALPAVAASEGTLQYSSVRSFWNPGDWFTSSEKAKDYALPNSSWSQDMLSQFNKLTEMGEGRTWKRLPSYRHYVEYFPEKLRRELKLEDTGARQFLRNVDVEGMGFEYTTFVNPSEQKVVCLFQPGPYLEGHQGFTHGGSTATILDATFGATAIYFAGRVMTANLTINYKSPIPLGSVVLVECKLDRTEGRKLFITGTVQSVDGQTLHAEAKALFIQLQSKKPSSDNQTPRIPPMPASWS